MKHIKLIPSLLLSLSLLTSLATPISAANLPANYYVSIAKERGTDGYNNSSKFGELDAYGEPYPYSYYYYSTDKTSKQIYVQLYNAFHDRAKDPVINSTDSKLIGNIAEAILEDCPELYYISDKLSFTTSSKGYTTVNYTLLFTENQISNYNKKLTTSVKAFENSLPDKDLFIYDFYGYLNDYIATHITYDYSFSKSNRYNVIGGLIEGTGVCESYTKSFNYICKKNGIPTGIKKGSENDTNTRHEWSIVPYNNKWYNIDVTFNDGTEQFDLCNHMYFMLSDSQYQTLANVTIGKNCKQFYTPPKSKSSGMTYYKTLGYELDNDTISDSKTCISYVDKLIKRAKKKGFSHIELYVPDSNYYKTAYTTIGSKYKATLITTSNLIIIGVE